MIGSSSRRRTDIGTSEYFAIQVTLRNAGEVPWEGRLLSRLGVAVSTVMPMTPRVIPRAQHRAGRHLHREHPRPACAPHRGNRHPLHHDVRRPAALLPRRPPDHLPHPGDDHHSRRAGNPARARQACASRAYPDRTTTQDRRFPSLTGNQPVRAWLRAASPLPVGALADSVALLPDRFSRDPGSD